MGRMIEILDQRIAGKTSFTLHCIAQAQEQRRIAAL